MEYANHRLIGNRQKQHRAKVQGNVFPVPIDSRWLYHCVNSGVDTGEKGLQKTRASVCFDKGMVTTRWVAALDT